MEKSYPTTHEHLCDKEAYVQNVTSEITKDAFGWSSYLHTSKSMEIMAESEYVRLLGGMTSVRYYLLD